MFKCLHIPYLKIGRQSPFVGLFVCVFIYDRAYNISKARYPLVVAAVGAIAAASIIVFNIVQVILLAKNKPPTTNAKK
jgi:hypothetical protein